MKKVKNFNVGCKKFICPDGLIDVDLQFVGLFYTYYDEKEWYLVNRRKIIVGYYPTINSKGEKNEINDNTIVKVKIYNYTCCGEGEMMAFENSRLKTFNFIEYRPDKKMTLKEFKKYVKDFSEYEFIQ